jgi:hypothetical protein
MQDDLTAAGRERWQQLANEAAYERRARTVAPMRRAPIRAGLAAVLIALAARLAPAPTHPAPTDRAAGTR